MIGWEVKMWKKGSRILVMSQQFIKMEVIRMWTGGQILRRGLMRKLFIRRWGTRKQVEGSF